METVNIFYMDDEKAYGIDPVKYYFCKAAVKDGQIVPRSVQRWLFAPVTIDEALEMSVITTYTGSVKAAPFAYEISGEEYEQEMRHHFA